MGGLRRNPVLNSLRRTLDAEKIAFEVHQGGKHPYVLFQVDGCRVRYPFPASTGDHRSHLAASTHVRRIIRTLRKEQRHVG